MITLLTLLLCAVVVYYFWRQILAVTLIGGTVIGIALFAASVAIATESATVGVVTALGLVFALLQFLGDRGII